MTESEFATKASRAPPPTNPNPNPVNRQQTMPHQQQVQQPQMQMPSQIPSSSLLFHPKGIDPKYDPMAVGHTVSVINLLEPNYQIILEKYAKPSQAEVLEALNNGSINLKAAGPQLNALQHGFLCGILLDPVNAEKYFHCLNMLAEADQWTCAATALNMILLEAYTFLKFHCRQQLVVFFELAIKQGIRHVDMPAANFCRALSDGSDFRDTCTIAHQFAQRLLNIRQHITIQSGHPRSYTHLVITSFNLFSRLVADAQAVASAGVMSADSFKQPLISICEFLIRERFIDLLGMGPDLLLAMMRFAKTPQFMSIWRSLLHNPAILAQNFNGVQQLFRTIPNPMVLRCRVSNRITRKLSDILNKIMAVQQLGQPNNPMGRAKQQQMYQELNRNFDEFKTMHLSGPDSGSIRAEIMRHILSWAYEPSQQFFDARAVLMGWLLEKAKPGADAQWCKLVFFWEWYGFEPTTQGACFRAEPVLSTLRHLLTTSKIQLCNSLVEFLIKSTSMLCQPQTYFFTMSITTALRTFDNNLQVQSVFSHLKLDPQLKETLRNTFPDAFPKRVTSIADNLAEPSDIIDFDAIRGSAPTTPTEPNAPEASTSSGTTLVNGKGSGAAMVKGVKIEPKMSHSDGKLASATKSMADGPALKKPKISSSNDKLTTHSHPVKKVKAEPAISEMRKPTSSTTITKEADSTSQRKRKRKVGETAAGKPVVPAAAAIRASTSRSGSTAAEARLTIDEDEDEQHAAEEGTSKQMPLNMLLNMLRMEFREPLEALGRAINGEGSVSDWEEQAIKSLQNLMDNIFDTDDMDTEQTEFIALCLLRIFNVYLTQKSYFPRDDATDDCLSEAMEEPIYRFFKILCQASEEAGSRKSMLAIVARMCEECARIGYLFLFFLSNIGRERRLRADSGPTAEQTVAAYKDIAKQMDTDWDRQLAKDLEQCHMDDRELFAHVLIGALTHITPYGPPARVMRVICGCADPRLLARLQSEIVRENVVLFADENINKLHLLTESLKWDAFEQMILWQLVQTEAVQFDVFWEIIQRLNYNKHPEAISAILVIIRNMEPGMDIDTMKSLLRNLLLRPPQLDLFTVDAIKLIIDYDENIPYVADSIRLLVKRAITDGDIMAPVGKQPAKVKRVLTAEGIFGHLDRLRQHCMQKESRKTENLFKHDKFLEMAAKARQNPKLADVRPRFDELFALFEILLDEKQGGSPTKAQGPGKRRKAAQAAASKSASELDLRDSAPSKRPKKSASATAVREPSSSSDGSEVSSDSEGEYCR